MHGAKVKIISFSPLSTLLYLLLYSTLLVLDISYTTIIYLQYKDLTRPKIVHSAIYYIDFTNVFLGHVKKFYDTSITVISHRPIRKVRPSHRRFSQNSQCSKALGADFLHQISDK